MRRFAAFSTKAAPKAFGVANLAATVYWKTGLLACQGRQPSRLSNIGNDRLEAHLP